METNIRMDTIIRKFLKLKRRDSKFRVPGAIKHRYDSQKVDEKAIYSFEDQIGISLPIEFRSFLKVMGFGAGPGNGILPFNEQRLLLKKWEDDLQSSAETANPFQYSTDVAEMILFGKQSGSFYEKKKLTSLDGLMPICHYGGTHYVFIVLKGEETGKVWTLNTDGYETLPTGEKRLFYFLDWVEDWLDRYNESGGEDTLANFYKAYLEKLFPPPEEAILEEQKKIFLNRGNLSLLEEIEADEDRIEWLSITDCMLGNLPDKLFGLGNLVGLDLSMNNISGIYSSMKNLKNLRFISLSHNNLKVIPDQFKHFKKLKSMDLSYNNIESIPDFIGELEELEILNLSNNAIKSIHTNITKLRKLSKLDLSYNQGVFGLNSLISSRTIEILDISGCELQIFPYYITMIEGLKKLYMIGNDFNKLPQEFTSLKDLEVLVLNEGIAENLEESIERIAGLEKLKEVTLPYIDLTKLPRNFIKLRRIAKILLYPVGALRGRTQDQELANSFLSKVSKVFPQSRVELIY